MERPFCCQGLLCWGVLFKSSRLRRPVDNSHEQPDPADGTENRRPQSLDFQVVAGGVARPSTFDSKKRSHHHAKPEVKDGSRVCGTTMTVCCSKVRRSDSS